MRPDIIRAESQTDAQHQKSVEHLLPVHEAQLITYLRLTGKHVGLLINFNVPVLIEGIIRRVL